MRHDSKVVFFLSALSLLVLAGCETAEGLGRDTQKAGDWIERQAADDDDED